jgi:TRAP-type C4-dicarboxylate transport system substrate-binding protein
MALLQKVIDGAENFPITLFTSKHWEVCVDKAAFEKVVQPVFDAYIKQQGKNLLDQIRAAKKK